MPRSQVETSGPGDRAVVRVIVPRYKLIVAYDGTAFCGWQKQEPFAPTGANKSELSEWYAHAETVDGRPDRVALRTVQHVLERAVREVVREPIVLMGASRTDSGVHARGQVAAFTCRGEEEEVAAGEARGIGWPSSRGCDRLLAAINGRLPDDVLVVEAHEVAPGFDPIGDVDSKGYSYTLHTARERPLFDRHFVHHVRSVPDVASMDEAANHFIGEHDFASFAATGHGRLTTVRRVLDCQVMAPSADRVRIEISGTGFLWNMVRIIAGTLLHVGLGRLSAQDIPKILASRDRAKAGPTLPPTGLCLEWVRYRSGDPDVARTENNDPGV